MKLLIFVMLLGALAGCVKQQESSVAPRMWTRTDAAAGGAAPAAPPVPADSAPASLALSEQERHAQGSPAVLAAMAELESAAAGADAASAHGGPAFFAAADYTGSREPESLGSSSMVSYSRAGLRGGLSIPLLGAWAKNKEAELLSQQSVFTAQQKASALQTSALASLRTSYAVRWQEKRRRAFLNAYLKDAGAADALLRRRLGENMLLESAYREFQASEYDVRSRLSRSLALEEKGRALMRLVTGFDTPPDRLTEPDFPRVNASLDDMVRFAETDHPETASLAGAENAMKKLPSVSVFRPFDVQLEGGYTQATDYPGATGRGGGVGLRLQMPLTAFSEASALKREALADERRARLERVRHTEQLKSDLRTAVAEQYAALDAVAAAHRRLGAAVSAEKEMRLRLGVIEGGMFEQYLNVRRELLAAIEEELDAEENVLVAQIGILRLATDAGAKCTAVRDAVSRIPRALKLPSAGVLKLPLTEAQRAALGGRAAVKSPALDAPAARYAGGPFGVPAGSPAVSAPPAESRDLRVSPSPVPAEDAAPAARSGPGLFTGTGWEDTGFYVWKAAPLLDPAQRGPFLRKIRAAGAKRILVSFTGRELAAAGAEGAVASLCRDAKSQGLSPVWLLGDPSWILPEHRENLVQLVGAFADAPFDGVHLDLEPDQLTGGRARLAAELLKTVQAVAGRAPWPVGVSLHPRYLTAGGPSPRLAAELAEAGVSEIAVMAYAANRDALGKTLDDVLQNCRRSPRLVLAQSVEETEPVTVSLRSLGAGGVRAWLSGLHERYAGRIAGILLQDWNSARGLSGDVQHSAHEDR